jgi:transcriptional regulator with XRE-family HTH domain
MERATMKKATKRKAPAKSGAPQNLTATGRVRHPLPKLYQITRNAKNDPNGDATNPNSARATEFGRRLRNAMLASRIKQIELAEKTGIGRDSISGYARGKNFPSYERIELIAKVLGITADELMPRYDANPRSMTPGFNIEWNANGKTGCLQINEELSVKTITQIVELVTREKEARAKKG